MMIKKLGFEIKHKLHNSSKILEILLVKPIVDFIQTKFAEKVVVEYR